MSKKWNMIVDVSRCENCRNCFLVVKDEHIGNAFPGYAAAQPPGGHNWIDIQTQERGHWPVVEVNFMPVMCNHCDAAPCMRVAKGGAVRKREDGIVIIDPEKSRGQKAIADACPYGAISWNAQEQIPQAWIFDAHLLDRGWTKTRVETVCPTGVFTSVKVEDDEMWRIREEDGLEVLQPELGTKPRVYYRNLHLMNKCFVAGSAIAVNDGIEECVEAAEVVLKQNGDVVARMTTDIFGDFKIDKLERDSGRYELSVSSDSLGSRSVQFELGSESVYLGAIRLEVGL